MGYRWKGLLALVPEIPVTGLFQRYPHFPHLKVLQFRGRFSSAAFLAADFVVFPFLNVLINLVIFWTLWPFCTIYPLLFLFTQDQINELHKAAARGNVRDFQQLLDRSSLVLARDPLGATPLHKAILYGHYDLAEYIASNYGANVLDSKDNVSRLTVVLKLIIMFLGTSVITKRNLWPFCI